MGPDPFRSSTLASIRLTEPAGHARRGEVVRIGVPLPRGRVASTDTLALRAGENVKCPAQFKALARWPDGSVKWALVDALVDVGAREGRVIAVTTGHAADADDAPHEGWPVRRVAVSDHADGIEVVTGAARFVVPRAGEAVLRRANVCGSPGEGASCELRLRDRRGRTLAGIADRATVVDAGPVTATIHVEGRIRGEHHRHPVEFRIVWTFHAGSRRATAELRVRNPRAARHAGGLWDLGDPGSAVFADLTLRLVAGSPLRSMAWRDEAAAERERRSGLPFMLVQDSSGGEHWASPTHVDARGRPTVTFRGWCACAGRPGAAIASGRRATPMLVGRTRPGWIAAAMPEFWQTFPNAMRADVRGLEAAVFPAEAGAPHELQGGEQTRAVVVVEVGGHDDPVTLGLACAPLQVMLDPDLVEASGAIPTFVARTPSDDPRLDAYLRSMVEGEASLFAGREAADEYGWRNFGDLHADHEAVHHDGPAPFVSHYNNQYDFVFGALVQWLRHGDARWWSLAAPAARHAADIDIYHTTEDRPAYNGGAFWHTDHYKPASTATHRTYSRANRGAKGRRDYGGGPGNEHNYTTGLLCYHYLTGDADAAEAVRSLADWVVAMDDGSRTPIGVFCALPTGLSSRTVTDEYHGPGRGAGNSINALLDAFALAGDRAYLEKAEALVRRCVHPNDAVASRGLDDPERRWSYLVFLQVLGKYLRVKEDLDETDFAWDYARASLLRYAEWMLVNERPYREVLHKVEIPSETWPAHDIRKCHVFHLAARYAPAPERERYAARARVFFDRCLDDVLAFDSAFLLRPRVILCANGHVHACSERASPAPEVPRRPPEAFGEPTTFVPQRAAAVAHVASRASAAGSALARAVLDRFVAFAPRRRRGVWNEGGPR